MDERLISFNKIIRSFWYLVRNVTRLLKLHIYSLIPRTVHGPFHKSNNPAGVCGFS